MLKWIVHAVVIAIGVWAFLKSNIDSRSMIEAGLLPFVAFVALVYAIVVVGAAIFGWSGLGFGSGSSTADFVDGRGTFGPGNDGGNSGDGGSS